jgi:hypothetical protein
VPNDILIVGGAGIASCPAIDGDGDDSDHVFEENTVGNSVVICTGANACGKVRESLYFLFPKVQAKTFCETQSVYLKQVRFIRVLFSEKKIFGPRLLSRDHKDRIDTINGTSRLFISQLYPLSLLKQRSQIGWYVYILRLSLFLRGPYQCGIQFCSRGIRDARNRR